jgi:hypothetical protein
MHIIVQLDPLTREPTKVLCGFELQVAKMLPKFSSLQSARFSALIIRDFHEAVNLAVETTKLHNLDLRVWLLKNIMQ